MVRWVDAGPVAKKSRISPTIRPGYLSDLSDLSNFGDWDGCVNTWNISRCMYVLMVYISHRRSMIKRRAGHGPVRMNKRDGQVSTVTRVDGMAEMRAFVPKPVNGGAYSKLVDVVKNKLGSARSAFTGQTCLDRGSLERENIVLTHPQPGFCPPGFTPLSHQRDGLNYRNHCIRKDYDTTTPSVVADCCNGTTPAKNCDPSLCRGSSKCREKMMTYCDSASTFGTSRCQKWLDAVENEDVAPALLAKYCKGEDFASGKCRSFASTRSSYGKVDAEMKRFCTEKFAQPLPVAAEITEWAKWRLKGGKMPASYIYSSNEDRAGLVERMDREMYMAISRHGEAEVLAPTVQYKSYAKDPLCACIMSSANAYGASAPPSCFDSACTGGGYQTAGQMQIAIKCPSYTDCRASVLASSGGSNSAVNIQQMCGPAPPASPVLPNQETQEPGGATPGTIPTVPSNDPGVKDDHKLLTQDEENANPASTKPASTPAESSAALNAGQMVVLFFAVVVLTAILGRAWMNHRAHKQAAQAQALEQLADRQANMAQIASDQAIVREAVQKQVASLG